MVFFHIPIEGHPGFLVEPPQPKHSVAVVYEPINDPWRWKEAFEVRVEWMVIRGWVGGR